MSRHHSTGDSGLAFAPIPSSPGAVPAYFDKVNNNQNKTVKDQLEEEHGKALQNLKQFGHRLVILGAIGLGLATYFLTSNYDRDAFQQAVSSRQL